MFVGCSEWINTCFLLAYWLSSVLVNRCTPRQIIEHLFYFVKEDLERFFDNMNYGRFMANDLLDGEMRTIDGEVSGVAEIKIID